MSEKLFERNSRHLRERNGAWEERDRYKKERDELLLKLAEIMDEEALDDAKQIPSSRRTSPSQSG